LNVQGALIGIETGVLDGQDDGIRVRVVVVGMVPSRWGDKDTTADPVDPQGILDPSIFAEFRSHEGIDIFGATRYTQVEGDGVMSVGSLYAVLGKDIQEGPENVRDGSRARIGLFIAQENTDPVPIMMILVVSNLHQTLVQEFFLEERHGEFLGR